ncbi:hypothetical protein M9458_008619, partial [Cirrhinus mrigala]
EDIAELKELAPDAAVLTSIECSDTDSTSDSDTETGDLPEPLVALYDANLRCLSQNELHYNKQELSHVPAVLWGRDMEDTARRQYTEIMKTKHQNFDVELCGLVVRPDKPHLGASPDGIANCTCCGKATVEIKCPYKYHDGLTGNSEGTQFCLDKTLQLKKNHEYYHQ